MPTTLLLGASRGIGLELARQAVAAGERVIATARSDDGLATLRELGCQVLKLDVANPASVSGLAWQLDGEKIDTAWHVAGVMCTRADARQPPTAPGQTGGGAWNEWKATLVAALVTSARRGMHVE